MIKPRLSNFVFTLALASSLLAQSALSAAPEQPQPAAESRAEAASVATSGIKPEPESAGELPEVVVLYGREELIPWLESENWWGEVNREDQLTVPHIIITAIHPSWSKFSSTLPVPVKKSLFYRLMLPLVMHANEMTMALRQGLLQAMEEFKADGAISPESLKVVQRVAILLPGMEMEDAQTLQTDHEEMQKLLEDLLYRVDIVPAGLALGQAAYESGYGTSRFATEGNSLFGQWTYKGDGLKPKEQRTSAKGDHRIKAFEWPFDSVRGYFINLMSHRAYEDFRRLRAEMRAAGEPLSSMRLADGLVSYSERGQEYVDSLKGIMRVNKLDIADNAVFRDEPLRFLISEQSPEDVEKTREKLQQAEESGELAEIIERMRLE